MNRSDRVERRNPVRFNRKNKRSNQPTRYRTETGRRLACIDPTLETFKEYYNALGQEAMQADEQEADARRIPTAVPRNGLQYKVFPTFLHSP
ncbi:MAG: hypothetical protein N2C14_08505 [Planctomycetales bacterium]